MHPARCLWQPRESRKFGSRIALVFTPPITPKNDGSRDAKSGKERP